MEDALVQIFENVEEKQKKSLNPCFNGRCTSTCSFLFIKSRTCVLILVLMEDALVRLLFGDYAVRA